AAARRQGARRAHARAGAGVPGRQVPRGYGRGRGRHQRRRRRAAAAARGDGAPGRRPRQVQHGGAHGAQAVRPGQRRVRRGQPRHAAAAGGIHARPRVPGHRQGEDRGVPVGRAHRDDAQRAAGQSRPAQRALRDAGVRACNAGRRRQAAVLPGDGQPGQPVGTGHAAGGGVHDRRRKAQLPAVPVALPLHPPRRLLHRAQDDGRAQAAARGLGLHVPGAHARRVAVRPAQPPGPQVPPDDRGRGGRRRRAGAGADGRGAGPADAGAGRRAAAGRAGGRPHCGLLRAGGCGGCSCGAARAEAGGRAALQHGDRLCAAVARRPAAGAVRVHDPGALCAAGDAPGDARDRPHRQLRAGVHGHCV
ncbi:hypothetical protein GGF44_006098, partial [Coemansia sp. RSA 1694]